MDAYRPPSTKKFNQVLPIFSAKLRPSLPTLFIIKFEKNGSLNFSQEHSAVVFDIKHGRCMA